MKVRRYNMQDRSAAGTQVDDNLSIIQVYEMTDWAEDEFNQVLNLEERQEAVIGGWIYVYRRPDLEVA
jgi:hypothetical protein